MYITVIIQLCQGKYSFPFYGTFNVTPILWLTNSSKFAIMLFAVVSSTDTHISQ